jgi:hypothetical protein
MKQRLVEKIASMSFGGHDDTRKVLQAREPAFGSGPGRGVAGQNSRTHRQRAGGPYQAYETESDAIWLRGEAPNLALPSLTDIEEKAWTTFPETA